LGKGKNFHSVRLSPDCMGKLQQLWKQLDARHRGKITFDDAVAFFKSWSRLNAHALFDEMDVNGDAQITHNEFTDFFRCVKDSGYDEAAIEEEIDNLLDGASWVGFKHQKYTRTDNKTPSAKPLRQKYGQTSAARVRRQSVDAIMQKSGDRLVAGSQEKVGLGVAGGSGIEEAAAEAEETEKNKSRRASVHF